MDLAEWRRRIDALDGELVRLLNARGECVMEIGRIKREQQLELYDPAREAEVLRNALDGNRGPLSDEALERIFERVLDESRRLERSVLQK